MSSRDLLPILFLIFMASSPMLLSGQSFWFGVKGGGAMNLQSWGDGSFGGSINRDPLFSLNGDIFMESLDDLRKGSLYVQAGYHTRGSALRFFSFNNSFSELQGFKFRNLVAEVGAKKPLNLIKSLDPYFVLGVRGEYTLNTNLDDFLNYGSLFYPVNEFVRKINYGLTFGGGIEKVVSEVSNLFFEFTIQPDLSFQYEQQPLNNVIDPWTRQPVSIGLRQVRNLSIEVKAGIKFLRKVIYED